MSTLYNFLLQKSAELGSEKCSNCGKQDAAFGLGVKDSSTQGDSGGYCIYCGNAIKKYTKAKTFQYCLEVYKEIFSNYNDQASPEDKKMAEWVINVMLVEGANGSKLPTNENILKFQTLNVGLSRHTGHYAIGSSSKMAGYVVMQKDKVSASLDEKVVKRGGEAYAVGIAAFCVRYLIKFEVANEFVLPTVKKNVESVPSTKVQEPKSTQNKNSGCFSFFLIVIICSALIILI